MTIVRIERKKSSFDFFYNDPKKGPFTNRLKNNFGDTVRILGTDFEGRIQSVANHPSAPLDGSWSLSPGWYYCKAFQPQREFNCPVHGIGGGYNLQFDWISQYTFDIKDSNLRHLFHDDQTRGKNRAKLKDSGAYSAGCMIQPMDQYAEFNKLIDGDFFLNIVNV
jgi:hypothetical protein